MPCPKLKLFYSLDGFFTSLPCKRISKSLAVGTTTTLEPAPLKTAATVLRGDNSTSGCPRADRELDSAQMPLAAVKSAPEKLYTLKKQPKNTWNRSFATWSTFHFFHNCFFKER